MLHCLEVKMKNKFLVPIVTPFKANETVDYEALKTLTKKLLNDGADGIYASGSSAECFLLSEEERRKTLEAVIEAADGAYVVAHVGNIGTKNSVALARHAKAAGADAIASVPPFYFNFPFEFRKMNANHSSERPASLYGQSLHNNPNMVVSM